MNTFKVGDVAKVTFNVYATNSTTLVAPTSIAASSVDPTGTITGITLTNAGTGIYTGNVNLTQQGIWYVRATTTGTYQAAEELEIPVEPYTGP